MLGAVPIIIDPIFSGLAWSLIFGLFASTVFTLFVIPVAYWLLYANKRGHGLPLSAIISSHELQERWGRGAHGTTYGGNPVACAAGLAVLDTIADEHLVENARARGVELSGGLRELMAEFPAIGDVRGPGLMIGVEFVRDRSTREPDGATAEAVAARAAENGLLLLTCGIHHQVIRWIPPIDVTVGEVEEALGTFERALRG